MGAVRGKETQLEVVFRKRAWELGLRYRKNVEKLLGKPDLAIKRHKIVVFLDSCFWHGCPRHCRIPSSRRNYWAKKIARNKKRDNEVKRYYKNKGWAIFRFWEHQLKSKDNIDRAIEVVLGAISD